MRQLKIHLVSACGLPLVLGCAASSDESPSAQGNTVDGSVTSTTTTGGTATTADPSTTSVTASTSDVTSTTTSTTTGSGGTGGEEMTCATRPVITVPTLATFEDYDGVTAAADYGFAFNDSGTGTGVLYGGLYDNSDGSGSPSLVMVAGNGSSYAVSGSNTEASTWGGGVGFWLGCMNASSYTGISLAVRGTTPNENMATVSLSVDGLTDGVGTDIMISDTFSVFTLPFTMFTNDAGETTNGDNITGLSVGAQMVWVEDTVNMTWVPEPAPYEIVVDDVSFY